MAKCVGTDSHAILADFPDLFPSHRTIERLPGRDLR